MFDDLFISVEHCLVILLILHGETIYSSIHTRIFVASRALVFGVGGTCLVRQTVREDAGGRGDRYQWEIFNLFDTCTAF